MKQIVSLHRAVAIVALALSASAQNVASPDPLFDRTEGFWYAGSFGSLPNLRMQLADGSLWGTARVIRGVEYRADHTNHDPSITAAGRKWQSVDLTIGEFDMSKLAAPPSSNVPQLATSVFRGPVAWPSLSGWPTRRPAPWSYLFPFRQVWLYSGRLQVLCDYRFTGGTLDNAQTWATTREYRLDSYSTAGYAGMISAPVTYLGKHGPAGGCEDSGNSRRPGGAYTTLGIGSYGPGHPDTTRRDTFEAWIAGNYFGLTSPITTTIGVLGSRPPIAIPGVTCNLLHMDYNGPTVTFYDVARPVGTVWGSLAPRMLMSRVPIRPVLFGQDFLCQSAWRDSLTGEMRLTPGCTQTLAFIPSWKNDDEVPRRGVRDIPGTFVSSHPWNNPICLYR